VPKRSRSLCIHVRKRSFCFAAPPLSLKVDTQMPPSRQQLVKTALQAGRVKKRSWPSLASWLLYRIQDYAAASRRQEESFCIFVNFGRLCNVARPCLLSTRYESCRLMVTSLLTLSGIVDFLHGEFRFGKKGQSPLKEAQAHKSSKKHSFTADFAANELNLPAF